MPRCSLVPFPCPALKCLQGFQIGEFSLNFRINLNITTTTAGNSTGSPALGQAAGAPNSTSQVLAITPAQPFQRDASHRLSAKLLGDLAQYQQESQLDGKWLMVPFADGEQAAV